MGAWAAQDRGESEELNRMGTIVYDMDMIKGSPRQTGPCAVGSTGVTSR